MDSKICEGISCSSFYVKELDLIIRENYFLCITLVKLGHSVPHITGEPDGCVGTRHSHQILSVKSTQIRFEIQF